MGLEGIYKGRTEPVLVVLDRGQQACIPKSTSCQALGYSTGSGGGPLLARRMPLATGVQGLISFNISGVSPTCAHLPRPTS